MRLDMYIEMSMTVVQVIPNKPWDFFDKLHVKVGLYMCKERRGKGGGGRKKKKESKAK